MKSNSGSYLIFLYCLAVLLINHLLDLGPWSLIIFKKENKNCVLASNKFSENIIACLAIWKNLSIYLPNLYNKTV